MLASAAPELSLVAPVHNEEGNVAALFTGICAAMEPLGRPFEVLLVNAAHMYSLRACWTVVRCFRMVSGDYFLGGQFTRALQPDEFMPFMV